MDTRTVGLQMLQSVSSIGNCIIIWLDPQQTIHDLDELLHDICGEINCTFIWKFKNSDPCIDILTDIIDKLVILVLPCYLAETLVPLVHDVPQLDSIYIYDSKTNKNQWTKTWKKVKGFFENKTLLFDQLKTSNEDNEQDLMPISIIQPYSKDEFNGVDQAFMYSQLLKEILLEMKYDYSSKKFFLIISGHNHPTMIVICMKSMNVNETMNIIRLFGSIQENLFFYYKLNLALRKQDMGYVVKMGFYLQDLHRQIEQPYRAGHLTQKFIVYRRQGMKQKDFEKLEKNVNGLLTFNSFLSTSTDREVAHGFALSALNDFDVISIVFQMEIDPQISSNPFAAI